MEQMGFDFGEAVVLEVQSFMQAASRPWQWSQLDAERFDSVGGGAVEMFTRNVAAITLLLEVEAYPRPLSPGDRDVLTAYRGWGGLPKVFVDGQSEAADPSWVNRGKALSELLSDDEWASARESTLNAHYTSGGVIDLMWKLAMHLGFRSGSILEPGAGIGTFAGFVPSQIGGAFTLVESDSISARIAKLLYRDQVVLHEGFEHVNLARITPSLVIGNVPFGNYKLGGDCAKFGNLNIHNHFIAKSLHGLAPGGLALLITSSYTMDAKSSDHRAFFSEQANLVGAIRLPSMAFRRMANTSVTTDILAFHKPLNLADRDVSPGWVKTTQHDGMTVNTYFVEHPDAVIGKLALTDNGYSKSTGAVFAGSDTELLSALQKRIEHFPQFDEAELSMKQAIQTGRVKSSDTPRFGYQLIDGEVWKWDGSNAFPHKATAVVLSRIGSLCGIRDVLRSLISKQMADDVGQVESLREQLNTQYDAFVKAHGPISGAMPRRAFKADPDLPLLLSLEAWDEDGVNMEKAAIFSRNTHAVAVDPSVQTVDEAIRYVLSDVGHVDFAESARLLGGDADAGSVKAQALNDGTVFVNPVSGTIELADLYLSGDVKTKLAQAKKAGDAYLANVRALEARIPEDILPGDIDVQMGAGWIPESDYLAFFDVLYKTELVSFWTLTMTHNAMVGWVIECDGRATSSVRTSRMLEAAMNGRSIRVMQLDNEKKSVVNVEETLAARERLDEIKSAFVSWIWADEDRANRLAAEYNERYNRYVRRDYDGSKMQLPGYSWALTPHPHQLNGAQRIVETGNALLAHVVGAGKTLTMVIGAMEAKRLGRVRKPMFVVPNHMLYQFGAEFMQAYPKARLLLADKDDLCGANRLEFVSRVATGDWDGIIMGHSTFERVPLSAEARKAAIADQLEVIVESIREAKATRGTRAVKELERAKKVWEARLETMQSQWKKDTLLSFEDLGVDALFIDEAHLFKNLYRFSRMERVAGLGAGNSQRSFDLLLKVREVQAAGGKVVFATGTPISNTMAEMWVMQTFLQPAIAGEFDDWASRFGRVVTSVEVAPDGGFRLNSRFAKFVNVPELMSAFNCVADIQTASMLKLPVPHVDGRTETLPMDESLRAYTETLVKRAEKIRQGSVDPRDDNMLKVTSDGRKAALDGRLVGYPGGEKVRMCATRVHEEWAASTALKGTQLVFCDLSTPSQAEFNVYDELRSVLVAFGIPNAEIAYIHEANTDREKATLFAKVRIGKVRVLIGSTSKMGMGTNVQRRLIALHHLDAPWRPSDVEQREGRIVRQGNGSDSVRIYRYVTQGSFDAYMWQTLETKARFIAQVMQGDNLRSMDDLEGGPLSYAEIKALASGNPVVMEKVKVDSDVAKYTILRDRWLREVRTAKSALANAVDRGVALHKQLAMAEEAKRQADALPSPWSLVSAQRQVDAELIGAHLEAVRARLTPYRENTVGQVGAFTLRMLLQRVSLLSSEMAPVLAISLADTEVARFMCYSKHGSSIKAGITRAFSEMQLEPARMLERIAQHEGAVRRWRGVVAQPFGQEDALSDARKRQMAIDRELGLVDDSAVDDVAA